MQRSRAGAKVISFPNQPPATDIFDRAQGFLNMEAANDKVDAPMPLGLCMMLWLVLAGIGWTAFEILGSML